MTLVALYIILFVCFIVAASGRNKLHHVSEKKRANLCWSNTNRFYKNWFILE